MASEQASMAQYIRAHRHTPLLRLLLTHQGLLKSETECAPNGYFFVPVYDAGAYDLEVAVTESAGWTFEATRQSVRAMEQSSVATTTNH